MFRLRTLALLLTPSGSEAFQNTPQTAARPVPIIMAFGGGLPGSARTAPPAISPAQQGAEPGPSWQAQVLAKGWSFATLNPASIQADNGAGLRKGIIGLVNKGQPRKPKIGAP